MTTSSATRTYAIDAAHTNIRFSVRHMMVSRVHGSFTGVSGTIDMQDGATAPSAVDVTIDATTIATGDAQRDGHLKSPDFFDVERFPTLAFRSTRVDGSGESFKIAGDLTIHGVTQPAVLDATFEGRGPDLYGNERVGFEASTKIDRKAFGLVWNHAIETGGVAVGDEIKIELSVEVIAPK